MIEATAREGAPHLWPRMTHAAWATGSADGLSVWVAETHFPIVYRETSLSQVGGALLLVFRTEHLLFNRQPWCHDLPAWVAAAAAAAEYISV